MNVSAYIPIKKFSTSKKRLSNIIDYSERESLAASMAKNTIDILSKSIDLPSNKKLASLPLTEQIKEITKYVVLVKVK